jgi:hypothetical protein
MLTKENDYVDQDDSGSGLCVRRHLRRSGVCWSQNLRIEHDAVRQLGYLDWPLLRLRRLRAVSAVTSEDTRPKAAIFFRRPTRESFCNASLAQQVRVSEREPCAEKRVNGGAR